MQIDERLKAFMAACHDRIERSLNRWLPSGTSQPAHLHRAMRHAAMSGGKRVRPVLVYASGYALGLPEEQLDGPACAVELMHAYSLVHDDLPAMDDDDLRRGQPTCHKAFDEATAILAGDALQTLAFQVLAADPGMPAASGARLRMIEQLARASGSKGMAGGQAMDLAAVGRDLDLLELENIHIHKTGALIRASVRLGTLFHPELDPGLVRRLDHYASCIGLAFQVQDDILDVEGETAALGKTRGKDQAQHKATYPSLLGLSESREKAGFLYREAIHSLREFDDRADPLRGIADYIVVRNR